MSIACVLITHLPAKAELRRHPELRKKPVIIVTGSGRGASVMDMAPGVRGVAVGMPLQEAISRCKSAALLEADGAYYHRVFGETVEALLKTSPVVEKGELGCAYVDVHGSEEMYGGDARIATALLDAVPNGFNPRIGLAKTKFPAYIAAVRSGAGRATKVPDDIPGFLRDLPVGLLPISWGSRVRLHGFGLRTMGQVARLSIGSLQAQFGTEGRLAWELSNGIDGSPLIPVKYQEEVSESLVFPVPATTLYAILPAVDMLLGRVFACPLVRGKYIRSVTVEANVLNRSPWSKKIVFKGPVNTKEKAMFVLKNALDAAEPPGPLEDMRLTVSELAGESGSQSSLFVDVRKQEQLRETMRQLETRLRKRPPIYNVMDVEPWSRLPERRQALVQFAP